MNAANNQIKATLCKGGLKRGRWAVGLCFASATLTGLQALNPDACSWMGLDGHQSFALSATIATISIFMATFILTELAGAKNATE